MQKTVLGCAVLLVAAQSLFASVGSETVEADPTTRQLRIDLNEAPPRELALLPNVGPVLATRIAQDRRVNGPFHSVDAVRRVHGIGEKTVQRIRSIAIVEPPGLVEQPTDKGTPAEPRWSVAKRPIGDSP